MLVNMKKMLVDAKNGKYAIPHININNLEWTRYVLEESQKLETPIILGVSEGAMKYMGGFKTVKDMVVDLMEYLNITVPVALHLDHGSSFEICKEAIDCGFTSVMIDASKYGLEDNIRITKEVVLYAKQRNVTVEAEIVKPENRIFVFRDQSSLRIAGRFSLPYIKQASFAPIAALVFLRSIFVYFLQKPTAPNAQTSFRILLRYTHGLNIFLAARSKFRHQNI